MSHGPRHAGKTREQVWDKWGGYGKMPSRIEYTNLPLHHFMPKVSALIGSMEWVESKRCEGWPPEFQDKYSDQISTLHFIDDMLRVKEWMPPRLGKKSFKPYAPNSFRSVERLTFKKSDQPRMLEFLTLHCAEMEEVEKDSYDDDTPEKHKRHNQTLSVLIELEKRFKAFIEGNKK